MVARSNTTLERLLLGYPGLATLFGRTASAKLLEPHPIQAEIELCALAAQSAAERRGGSAPAFVAVAGGMLDNLAYVLSRAEPAAELSGAPMVILVLAPRSDADARESMEAAIEVLLLALAALGYGWRLGPGPEVGEAIESVLGVRPDRRIYRLVETGTPNEADAPTLPALGPELTVI